MGLLHLIFPVFIGTPKGPCASNPVAPAAEYEDWKWSNLPATPNTLVKEVEEKLVHHLDSMALGMPLETNKTVKSVLEDITSNQGVLVQGEGIQAFELIRTRSLRWRRRTKWMKKRTRIRGPTDEISSLRETHRKFLKINESKDVEIGHKDLMSAQEALEITQKNAEILLLLIIIIAVVVVIIR